MFLRNICLDPSKTAIFVEVDPGLIARILFMVLYFYGSIKSYADK
jgi:hypothetical protein